jgi:hypothetical protein
VANTGFWIAVADNTGARVSGSELRLSPGPVAVDYAPDLLGSIRETAGGRAIVQQPSKDPRRREWIWKQYPGFSDAFIRQYRLLEALRSRYRVSQGLSPYVYLFDGTTSLFRRRVEELVTIAGSGNTSTVLSLSPSPAWADTLEDASIEIAGSAVGGSGTGAGQLRSLASNTAGTLTVNTAFQTIPNGAMAVVSYWVTDWFRVRVLQVSRKLRDDGGNVRYDETKLVFVVDDPTWNALG